jgi:hypothetical protein
LPKARNEKMWKAGMKKPKEGMKNAQGKGNEKCGGEE